MSFQIISVALDITICIYAIDGGFSVQESLQV
jgi:hypothetical protein